MSIEIKELMADFYVAGNGYAGRHKVPNIYPEDADWITSGGYKLTFEQMGIDNIVYLQYGRKDYQEAVVIAKKGEACRDAIRRLIEETKKLIATPTEEWYNYD